MTLGMFVLAIIHDGRIARLRDRKNTLRYERNDRRMVWSSSALWARRYVREWKERQEQDHDAIL